MRVRRFLLPAAALTLLVLAGCQREDPRLKNLTVGISKDSALSALGITNPERPVSYLYQGQFIERMILRREGADGPLDSLPRNRITPVVMLNGNLAGWGWKFWDSVAQVNNIPLTNQ